MPLELLCVSAQNPHGMYCFEVLQMLFVLSHNGQHAFATAESRLRLPRQQSTACSATGQRRPLVITRLTSYTGAPSLPMISR